MQMQRAPDMDEANELGLPTDESPRPTIADDMYDMEEDTDEAADAAPSPDGESVPGAPGDEGDEPLSEDERTAAIAAAFAGMIGDDTVASPTDEKAADEKPLLDPDVYDPEIVAVVTGLQKKVAELEAKAAAAPAQAAPARADRATELVSALAALPPEARSLFDGAEGDANRAAVVREMNLLRAGYRAAKESMPAPAVLLRKAVYGLFADKIRPNQQNAAEKGLAKPTARPDTLSDPTKRAVRAAERWIREHMTY